MYWGMLQGRMHPYSVPDLTSGTENPIQHRTYVFQAIHQGPIWMQNPRVHFCSKDTYECTGVCFKVGCIHIRCWTSHPALKFQYSTGHMCSRPHVRVQFGCKIRRCTSAPRTPMNVLGYASGSDASIFGAGPHIQH